MNTARLIIMAQNLIEALKGKDENACLLFIDFSTAYDKVLRSKLYQNMDSKKILNSNQMKLLRFIHKNITINYKKKTCQPETGVPQGCLTSPSLFNIYIEDLLDMFPLDQVIMFILAYADDIVFLIKYEYNIAKVINKIESCPYVCNIAVYEE